MAAVTQKPGSPAASATSLPRPARREGAAFFDLDRTLISRPTPLALAATFRRHGVVSTRDLVRASLWQLLFALPGVDGVRRASVDGMTLLKGLPVTTLEDILGEAMESVLRPLLFAGPLDLLERHRAAGERAYIVSASLHEIVQHVADDLGFDGAVGSTCEIVDGVYTGVSLRPCFGEHKAEAVRELAAAERIDLAASTGYSDSHTDLAFLEAVGVAVAVNPDRRLRRIASGRGWPILRFETLFQSPPA
jgi:HAD superfamily hydrolase (TIGR01490 family)